MIGSFPLGSTPLGSGDEEPPAPPAVPGSIPGGGGISLPRPPHWRYVPPRRKKVKAREQAPEPEKKPAPVPPPAPKVPERTAAERAMDEALAQEAIRSLMAQEQAIERMFQPQPDPAAAMRAQEEEELAILLQVI